MTPCASKIKLGIDIISSVTFAGCFHYSSEFICSRLRILSTSVSDFGYFSDIGIRFRIFSISVSDFGYFFNLGFFRFRIFFRYHYPISDIFPISVSDFEVGTIPFLNFTGSHRRSSYDPYVLAKFPELLHL